MMDPPKKMLRKYQNCSFESGVCLIRNVNDYMGTRERSSYFVAGRLEDGVPFLLSYSGFGVTSWWCKEQLGDGLRKKILGKFRKDVRQAEQMPSFITLHNLKGMADNDADREAEKVSLGFVAKFEAHKN